MKDKTCKNCGEPAHIWGCAKPPFISTEQWIKMDLNQKIKAALEAKANGYWSDYNGWTIVKETR